MHLQVACPRLSIDWGGIQHAAAADTVPVPGGGGSSRVAGGVPDGLLRTGRGSMVELPPGEEDLSGQDGGSNWCLVVEQVYFGTQHI